MKESGKRRSLDGGRFEVADNENVGGAVEVEGDEDDEAIRSRYFSIMQPLFNPNPPTDPDIIQLFASLLRVVGMEDRGWDPYAESRAVINDLYAMMQIELPADRFPDAEMTVWRLGLLFYTHIVEMNAPYEVLTNLLRYRLRKGYSPNPYYDLLTEKQKKQFRKRGLYPREKIEIIRSLGKEAGIEVASIFDEFFRKDLRNSISHSDFIFTDEEFRCRKGYGDAAFVIKLKELNDLLRRTKIFIGTFFGLDEETRRIFGSLAGTGKPYDPTYKGILEVLADGEGLMNGFKVHWPNGSESFYRRTPEGIDMCNCNLALHNKTIELFVGMYARKPGGFSPLVEADAKPIYTPAEGSDQSLKWEL